MKSVGKFCFLLIAGVLFSSCASDPKSEVKEEVKAEPVKVDTWEKIKTSDVEVHKMLQGDWVSTDDSLYVLAFEGDSVFDVFDNEVDQAAKFHIAKSCPDTDQAENAAKDELVLVKEGDNFCYSILFANETDLQLLYLAKGNMLSFKRAQ